MLGVTFINPGGGVWVNGFLLVGWYMQYPPINKHGTWKLVVCRCFSFSKGVFSGSMFVFKGVPFGKGKFVTSNDRGWKCHGFYHLVGFTGMFFFKTKNWATNKNPLYFPLYWFSNRVVQSPIYPKQPVFVHCSNDVPLKAKASTSVKPLAA